MSAETATTDPTPTQVLILAKSILSDPSKWTKGAEGRDVWLNAVNFEHAESFCVHGAVLKAAHTLGVCSAQAQHLLCEVGMSIAGNDADETTFADIHKALDKAIALSMEISHDTPL